jgi:uncharacterized membrane protein
MTRRYLTAFVATLLAFVALDAAWLVLVAGPFFKSQVGALLRAQPNIVAVVSFYPIYAAGLVVLVVAPALWDRSAKAAIWRGAVLGLTAYATFDLTNLAIIEGWTLAVTLFDVTWGTIASAVASYAGYHATRLTAGSAGIGA